ncbi:MAG: extracellular solute-binding protein, partial [Chloroflexi bacterium]|nr:extracellular solute-binding protein [Chloroflexota bacterium]
MRAIVPRTVVQTIPSSILIAPLTDVKQASWYLLEKGMNMLNRITRRDMLRHAGAGAAALLLGACAPKVIKETVVVEKPVEKIVEKVVKETVVVQGTPQVVEKVVKETVVVEKGRDIFKGELTLWHGWGNTGGGGLAMIDQCEGFMKLHPEVKMVNVFDANQDKWMAAIAGGNPPDLLKLNAPDIPSLGQRGALMPLDPFVERDNWDMSQYFDFAVDQCSWRDKLYAMTHHPDVRVFYRDLDVFQEVGLPLDKAPADWNEVYEWGKRMTKQEDGRYVRFGFVASWTSNNWSDQYMQANGVRLLSDDGRKAIFANELAEEAMSFVVKCVDDICGGRDNVEEFVEVNATPEGKGPYRMFPYHRMGMVHYGNWLLFPVSVINPEMKIGLSTIPGGYSNAKERFVFGGGTMVAIPSGAKHWELAWEWLKYLGGPEGAALVQARTADISGRKETARDPKVLEQHIYRKEMVEL